MIVKWSIKAIKNLINIIVHFESENEFKYVEKFQKEILLRTNLLIKSPKIYQLDRFKSKNDGTYCAFDLIITVSHLENYLTKYAF